ncbi:MAG: pilin, partial [Candidatus Doudnabacteria bacterium]|nr:pilin [Candidatus Doudnabacteria bacterium]
ISVFAYAGIVSLENFIGVKDIKYEDPATGIVNTLQAESLQGFVEMILRNTILISGLLAITMIIYNGFRYMTARGDDSQVATAKKGLTWSLLGLVLILFAYVIISAIAKLIS